MLTNHKEMKAIIDADETGKQIRWQYKGMNGWEIHEQGNTLDFIHRNYEILLDKPEPLECWVTRDQSGDIASAYVDKKLAPHFAIHMREVIEDEWVTDRDPTEAATYLVTVESKDTGERQVISQYYSTGWNFQDVWEIIAWRPRPEPWGGKE